MNSDKEPKGSKRSNSWPRVRKEHLAKNPACAVCGATAKDKGHSGKKVKIEVHHIRPFHLHPELELDPSNFITLCEESKDGSNHHLFVGHADDFKGFNPDVVKDAAAWSEKLSASKVIAKKKAA